MRYRGPNLNNVDFLCSLQTVEFCKESAGWTNRVKEKTVRNILFCVTEIIFQILLLHFTFLCIFHRYNQNNSTFDVEIAKLKQYTCNTVSTIYCQVAIVELQ